MSKIKIAQIAGVKLKDVIKKLKKENTLKIQKRM